MALYICAAAAVFFLLVASIVHHLFFRTPAVELPKSSIVTNQPDPRKLLECNDFVLEQLTDLSEKTNELFAQPLAGEHRDIASDWKNFSTKWRVNWDVIDARCRFTELAETNMGVAYDRMAHVHEALPAMRLKYNSLLAKFDKEQAAELSEMRRALEASRKSIAKRIETASSETQEGTR